VGNKENLNLSQSSIGSKGALKAVLLQQQREAKEAAKARMQQSMSASSVALAGEVAVGGGPGLGAAAAKSPTSRIPIRTPSKAAAAVNSTAAGSDAANNASINATLGKILGQLDLVTKTVIHMEARLSSQEDRISSLLSGAGVAGLGTGGGDGIIDAGKFDEEEEEEGGDV